MECTTICTALASQNFGDDDDDDDVFILVGCDKCGFAVNSPLEELEEKTTLLRGLSLFSKKRKQSKIWFTTADCALCSAAALAHVRYCMLVWSHSLGCVSVFLSFIEENHLTIFPTPRGARIVDPISHIGKHLSSEIPY